MKKFLCTRNWIQITPKNLTNNCLVSWSTPPENFIKIHPQLLSNTANWHIKKEQLRGKHYFLLFGGNKRTMLLAFAVYGWLTAIGRRQKAETTQRQKGGTDRPWRIHHSSGIWTRRSPRPIKLPRAIIALSFVLSLDHRQMLAYPFHAVV